MRDRAIRFSRNWSDATSERADKQTFYNEFFDVFGIRRASVAAFEANVRNLQGNINAIDLLWRGKLIVEHKTRPDGADLGARLNELFDWLNKPAANRVLENTHAFYGFRYVNGGLFKERLDYPRFNSAMREALLFCCEFMWAKISPAVFGSLFQGVMDDRARRQQRAHYTSERDIMKVLRSLLLDDLRAEWELALPRFGGQRVSA